MFLLLDILLPKLQDLLGSFVLVYKVGNIIILADRIEGLSAFDVVEIHDGSLFDIFRILKSNYILLGEGLVGEKVFPIFLFLVQVFNTIGRGR